MKTSAFLLIPFLGLAASLARAGSFTTYQAADVVLGQPDFTTSAHVTGKPNRFSSPVGVTRDAATGKVFVVDWGHHRVLRFSSEAASKNGSNPEIVFGQPNFSSLTNNQGGTCSATTMSQPMGVAVDALGTLWVADSGNNRVLGFYLASSIYANDPHADIVLGQPDFTTGTPTTTAGGMKLPSGVTAGHDQRLWVADYGNNRILRFDTISTLASVADADGVLGQPDFTTSSFATSATSFHGPFGVHADDANRLWVADTGNARVLRFDNAAAKLYGASADGVLGQPDFTTLAYTQDASHVGLVFGLCVDAQGTLWVTDNTAHRVIGFPAAASLPDGAAASIVLGKPDFATSAISAASSRDIGQSLFQISNGADGSLLVADSTYNRVLRFSPSADVVSPSQAAAPVVMVTGKKKLTTTKAKVVLAGKATGSVTSVTYKIGKKNRAAVGTSAWKLTTKLQPGKNKITIIAHGPGGDSAPVRMTVTRQ